MKLALSKINTKWFSLWKVMLQTKKQKKKNRKFHKQTKTFKTPYYFDSQLFNSWTFASHLSKFTFLPHKDQYSCSCILYFFFHFFHLFPWQHQFRLLEAIGWYCPIFNFHIKKTYERSEMITRKPALVLFRDFKPTCLLFRNQVS